MSKGSHWNRNARKSGGDRHTLIPMPSVGMDFAVLTMQIAIVRDKLGPDGVERFIKTLRERGDLQCTDAEAHELVFPAPKGTPST